MSLSSKSPRKVILVALAVGRESLADYSDPCSPKVFTQPQLFACLALKVFLGLDYRGVEQLLRDFPGIGQVIGLKKTPDHSTLHKAAKRFLGAAISEELLASTIHLSMTPCPRKQMIVRRAAADSTGLESGHRSAYFVRRRAKGQKDSKNPLFQATTYTRFPKLTLLADCATHLILALLTGTGPHPDMGELRALLAHLPRGVTLLKLLADAGFDSEPNHKLCRDDHGIQCVIPAESGRPMKDGGPPTGYWRRRMKRRLRTKRGRRRSGYTQRWQVETVMSMIKRNLGEELSGTSYHSRCREMRLLVIVHNIMILLFGVRVFDGAIHTPF